MTDMAVAELVRQLAGLGLAAWAGLPAGVALDAEDGLDAELGFDRLGASLVHLDDPVEGCAARAWVRDGEVVLVQVSWRSAAPGWPVEGVGEPRARTDVVDGLVTVEGGEWLYPGRGLAVVTNQAGTAVRHVLGFARASLDTYRRELRPDLATVRRPSRSSGTTAAESP